MNGIILCTDGLSSPYQSYLNFNNSFVKPMVKSVLETKSVYQVHRQIEDIASHLGVGDDVSLSFILNSNTPRKYYS